MFSSGTFTSPETSVGNNGSRLSRAIDKHPFATIKNSALEKVYVLAAACFTSLSL